MFFLYVCGKKLKNISKNSPFFSSTFYCFYVFIKSRWEKENRKRIQNPHPSA